ncbi:hypothetical protein CDL12_26314 [Handroanthus impetiginosus]|uniref:LRAT domain-containing protein n=1 Tax=Handroanthus impetiginosus TaxID=429701 RepID=A0A2G9G883_9LAMI|nr:hypothetical protein CDL12_26314 [Handroanthus impetiginosus]
MALSDPDDVVIHRAKYLLDDGFGCYDVSKNNCEDFALYCKTELCVLDQSSMGRSGQAASAISGATVVLTCLELVTTTNIYRWAGKAFRVYCAKRYAADIGTRSDVVKVPVEELTKWRATVMLQVLEPSLPGVPAPSI